MNILLKQLFVLSFFLALLGFNLEKNNLLASLAPTFIFDQQDFKNGQCSLESFKSCKLIFDSLIESAEGYLESPCHSVMDKAILPQV